MVHQYLSTGSVSDKYHAILGKIAKNEKSYTYIDQIDDIWQAEKQRIKLNVGQAEFRKMSIMEWEKLTEPWMKIMMPVLEKRLNDGPTPKTKPIPKTKPKPKAKPKPKPKTKPKPKERKRSRKEQKAMFAAIAEDKE